MKWTAWRNTKQQSSNVPRIMNVLRSTKKLKIEIVDLIVINYILLYSKEPCYLCYKSVFQEIKLCWSNWSTRCSWSPGLRKIDQNKGEWSWKMCYGALGGKMSKFGEILPTTVHLFLYHFESTILKILSKNW